MIMHPAIKLRHIRLFLEVAAGYTLSAVARRQGITQPALSRTLGELETLLGRSLFIRQGRRLVLTEAGIAFRRHAAQGIEALEAASRALQPGALGGRLVLGVLPTVAARLMPRAALNFRARAPELTLAIETGPHHHLIRLLREGMIDAMVGRMPLAREMSDLAFEHLYEDNIVLVVRADHPHADAPAPILLREVPLILPPVTAIIRSAVEDYLAGIGLAGARAAFETAAPAVALGLLRQSDAAWFISEGVVAEEISRGELAVIPTGMRFLSGAVGITTRGVASPEANSLALFKAVLREEAKAFRRDDPA